MEKHPEIFGKAHELSNREKFQKIKNAIEIRSDQVEKPSIEMSEFSLKELGLLEKGVDAVKNEQEPGLVAVMRGWNLGDQEMEGIIERINKIKRNIPALVGMFFVINGDGDKDNMTEISLQKIISSHTNEMSIVPVKVHNYTWTSGLNSAVAILNEMAIDKKIDRNKIKVLSISYGVDLEEGELDRCKDLINGRRFVMTMRNTEKALFDSEDELSWNKFADLLRNPQGSDLRQVLRSMRNTFSIMGLADIVNYGGFNPATVPLGGMEDADFCMRMILSALKMGKVELIKDFRMAMADPVRYSDQRWMKLAHLKDPSETAALEKILAGTAIDEDIRNNEYILPEANQDFRLRK